MDGHCICGNEEHRERLEEHEKEVRLLVHRYEMGQEEVDLDAVKVWFDRPRCETRVSAIDNYCPPKVQAAILYQTGAHKKSYFELLKSFK